jgi:hypothetical protein
MGLTYNGSIGLKSLHVNTLIDLIELDPIGILIVLKAVVYSFCNPTERTRKTLDRIENRN